jgi:hypothetical protein
MVEANPRVPKKGERVSTQNAAYIVIAVDREHMTSWPDFGPESWGKENLSKTPNREYFLSCAIYRPRLDRNLQSLTFAIDQRHPERQGR